MSTRNEVIVKKEEHWGKENWIKYKSRYLLLQMQKNSEIKLRSVAVHSEN